jgi:hypothetical protein
MVQGQVVHVRSVSPGVTEVSRGIVTLHVLFLGLKIF